MKHWCCSRKIKDHMFTKCSGLRSARKKWYIMAPWNCWMDSRAGLHWSCNIPMQGSCDPVRPFSNPIMNTWAVGEYFQKSRKHPKCKNKSIVHGKSKHVLKRTGKSHKSVNHFPCLQVVRPANIFHFLIKTTEKRSFSKLFSTHLIEAPKSSPLSFARQ